MNGFLVIGDVHAVFAPFQRAVQYAADHDLKLISVGDLNDQNDQGAQVFAAMREQMDQHGAQAVRGNHEWKVERFRKGNPVKIGTNSGSRITIEQMEQDAQFGEDFDWVVSRMQDVIQIGNTVIAHAGVNRKWWTGDITDKKARDTFFYGETNGERFAVGDKEFPVRTYGWAEHVPEGRVVIVGHDTRAMMPQFQDGQMTPPRSEPFLFVNDAGGAVWFADTGCGKSGTLSGVILDSDGVPQGWENFGD